MKKPIEIEFNFLGETHTARFFRDEYANNGSLYVGVITYDEEYKEWEHWSDLTVNLPGMCPDENKAFINTNNCAPEIIKGLEKAKFIKNTGVTRPSGFCVYPLYEFTDKFLEGMMDQE